MIEIKNISKSFIDKERGVTNNVIDDISITINKGESVAIIGKSGIGKSVLLKHMIGLVKPDRGNICIDGVGPWKERDWVGKIIKINNVLFKVEKNIPRCVAINLKPKSDDNSFN